MANNKSRVPLAFDARMVGFSGIGTQVSNILGILTRKKSVDLSLLGDPDRLRAAFPHFKGPVIPFPAPIYSIQEQLRPPRVPAGTLIHFPHYAAPALLAGRAVVCVHDLIHLQSAEFNRPHQRIYAHLMLQTVLRRARRIVTVSDTTREELVRRYPFAADRTVTVHNGLNHDQYYKADRASLNRFRKKYGLPNEFLLTVGIGKRHKNVDFLMRALLPLWRDGRLKIPLVMAGTGGQLPPYVQAAIEPEYERVLEEFVQLLPYIEEEEMPLMYGAAKLLIYPSLLEGFGFPMIEAMACGTPVLSSNRASLPEVGGEAAAYFDPEDQRDFVQTLETLLKGPGPLKKLSAAGLARSKQYDWNSHVDALVKIYESLAD